jgi:hypothetical protein
MEDKVYKSIVQEAAFKRATQKFKYNYSYVVSGIVGANTTAPIILAIEQDADFFIEKITGSVYGPVNAVTGVPTGGATDFDMPGTVAGFAARGLQVQITDTGAGRELTNGFIPLETLLTPGYGIELFQPYRINYMAKRNSKIRFDFRNRDSQANANHQVDITLNGYKYSVGEEDIQTMLKLKE